MSHCGLRVFATIFALAAGAPARAQDFYAGKTVTFSTHVAPGGGYDTYIRLLGRHIGRHVPGNPKILVSNQPGAGGLTAANFAGTLAPKDGTFATLLSQGLLLTEATGGPGLQVSLAKFNWIGNLSQANNVLAVWHTSRAKTIEDAKQFEVITGSTGVGSISSSLPAVYNAMLGTKFRIVYGYDGAGQLQLAMARGEIDGRGTNTWASYRATVPDDVKAGRIRALLQPVGARIVPLAEGARPPHFALVWLGMGGDGHIASLFPNTDPQADDPRDLVRLTPDPLPPEAPYDRLSLTIPALLACDALMFVIRGADKRALFEAALLGTNDLPVARLLGARRQPVTCFA